MIPGLLGIGPIGAEIVRTPSTASGQPHEAEVYDVTLFFVSGIDQTPLAVRALACEDFDRHAEGEVHGILGRDVLDHCNLIWLGPEKKSSLAY